MSEERVIGYLISDGSTGSIVPMRLVEGEPAGIYPHRTIGIDGIDEWAPNGKLVYEQLEGEIIEFHRRTGVPLSEIVVNPVLRRVY